MHCPLLSHGVSNTGWWPRPYQNWIPEGKPPSTEEAGNARPTRYAELHPPTPSSPQNRGRLPLRQSLQRLVCPHAQSSGTFAGTDYCTQAPAHPPSATSDPLSACSSSTICVFGEFRSARNDRNPKANAAHPKPRAAETSAWHPAGDAHFSGLQRVATHAPGPLSKARPC